jgi:glycerophosphoryl diester phosphodiesterase
MRCLQFSIVFSLCSFVAFSQAKTDALRRTLLDASSSTVMVASHRATHNRFPENSLSAIKESIRIGVDIIEIDIKVSKDGIPFLMHDRTLDRTTTATGDPEELTWDQLQKLFIVNNGKKTTLKIPSLEEALKLAYGQILVDLDLKTDRIEQVVDVVYETETKDIVFFFDSDFEVLSRIQAIDRDFMIMPRAHSLEQADSAIAIFDPPIVHIDFSFYTPECVSGIRSSSARVWINALGAPDNDIRRGKEKRALRKLLEHGASIIQTDEPQLLLLALREEGLHR